MVYGQNGIGQNGMDKMVRIKYHGSINQSRFHRQYNFFINPASTLTPLAFHYMCLSFILTFGY